MPVNIDSIEKDISELLAKGGTSLPPSILSKFGTNVALKLERQLNRVKTPRAPKTLRASEIGMADSCVRKLWYTYNDTVGTPLSGSTIMKFLYGDIIEESVLALAKAAGHKVEMEQLGVAISHYGWVIKGSIDAVIDETLVDVKSTTTYGMKDFVEGRGGDKFGYRGQLNIYNTALGGTRRKGWVAVDKTLGHIKWIEEAKPYDTMKLIEIAVDAVDSKHVPPMRILPEYDTSGNGCLSTTCSYCPYKKECWKDSNGGTGLKAYSYSKGPVFMVHVAKPPRVPEILL